MNIEIANRLVQLRKENGFSQEELAARLGISRQAVSKWERAESCPDTDNLICLSKLYHVSLDGLLLTGEEKKEEILSSESSGEKSVEQERSIPESTAARAVSANDGVGSSCACGGEEETREAPSGERESEPTPAAEASFPWKREVYDTPDGSRVETCRKGDEVTVTVTDSQGRSVTVIEKDGKKSLHFDGLEPNDPETEELLKKFRLEGTEVPGKNGMDEPLESFDGVPVKKKSKKKKKRGWFEGSYPVLCALIYLLIGFLWNLWHPGWLVFLTIPIYYTFEGCMYGTGNFKTALKATWPVCCAMIFLVLGCVWGLWHPGWLVFLTVPIIECL